MKRQRMGKHHSKHLFSHSADMTHKKNMPRKMPMRGGIRL
ncbi:MAG: hypothetical protein [Microvirus sp.]|nr:MAG: hypothetical protein [Microvirus sp.]